jgi:hypothetical protein
MEIVVMMFFGAMRHALGPAQLAARLSVQLLPAPSENIEAHVHFV